MHLILSLCKKRKKKRKHLITFKYQYLIIYLDYESNCITDLAINMSFREGCFIHNNHHKLLVNIKCNAQKCIFQQSYWQVHFCPSNSSYGKFPKVVCKSIYRKKKNYITCNLVIIHEQVLAFGRKTNVIKLKT